MSRQAAYSKEHYKGLHKYGPTSNKTHPCFVCRPWSRKPLYHRHFSTKYFYATQLNQNVENVECRTCKHIHQIEREEEKRVIVILSTSTLHNTFLNDAVKSPVHVNLETICGGTIDMLRENWIYQYSQETKPMDIIVVAGLNDLTTLSEEEFVEKIATFKRIVIQQNGTNSFTFAEMLRPPKYAWFPQNGPEPVGYINHLEKIDNVNEIIRMLNRAHKLSFATRGMRTRKKRDNQGNQINLPEHKFTDWREPIPAQCLHLNETGRANMFNSIIKFIQLLLNKHSTSGSWPKASVTNVTKQAAKTSSTAASSATSAASTTPFAAPSATPSTTSAAHSATVDSHHAAATSATAGAAAACAPSATCPSCKNESCQCYTCFKCVMFCPCNM